MLNSSREALQHNNRNICSIKLGTLFVILGIVVGVSVLISDVLAGQAEQSIPSGHAGHGAAVATITHSFVAIALAFFGTAIILAGLVLNYPESLTSVRAFVLPVGLTLLYADGLLHWLAVLEHLTEPLYAAFFIGSGAVQIGAVPLIRRRERLLWWVGVALTVFFIELYVLAVIVPPPFSLEPEAVGSLGLLSKVVEVGILVALALFFGPRIVPARLRIAVVNVPSLAFLFLGVIASLITVDFEAYRYWWVVSSTAFVVTNFLLIGLVAFASLAHYLRTGLLVGLTWSFAAMVIILHGIYAVNYASAVFPGSSLNAVFQVFHASAVFPLLLCILSGTLPALSMLSYKGRVSAKFHMLKVGQRLHSRADPRRRKAVPSSPETQLA